MSNKLVVLMLDGFRWDYYNRDKESLKGFHKLLSDGVQAEYLEPIFPVLSFPNWMSLSTGVFPDRHVIGNYMWDPSKGPNENVFHLMKPETQALSHWWENTAEPIWTTATKQGRRTFTRFWARSEIPYDGVIPEDATGYTYAPGAQAIEKTLNIGVEKLLQGFDFLMLYGEHIDNMGHESGPDSEDMKGAIRDVDEIIFNFLTKLDDANLNNVNLIVVSDHGMAYTGEASGTKYINLGDYITEEDVIVVLDSGTNICIAPVQNRKESVYEKLKLMEGATVYLKNEIPDEFHIKSSRYVLDLYLLAKPGYLIRGLPSTEKQIPFREFNPEKPFCQGVHGYVPEMPDQRGIFFAKGPAFKKGTLHQSINMLDIYQIFAHLLNIKAEENEGKWENVENMFVK